MLSAICHLLIIAVGISSLGLNITQLGNSVVWYRLLAMISCSVGLIYYALMLCKAVRRRVSREYSLWISILLGVTTVLSTVMYILEGEHRTKLELARISVQFTLSITLAISASLAAYDIVLDIHRECTEPTTYLMPSVLTLKSASIALCLFATILGYEHGISNYYFPMVCWVLAMQDLWVSPIILYRYRGHKASIFADALSIVGSCLLLAPSIFCVLSNGRALLLVCTFTAFGLDVVSTLLLHIFYHYKWKQRKAMVDLEYVGKVILETDSCETKQSHQGMKLLPKSTGTGIRILMVLTTTSAIVIEAFCMHDQNRLRPLRILTISILGACVLWSLCSICICLIWPRLARGIMCIDILNLVSLACAGALSACDHVKLATCSILFLWLTFAGAGVVVFLEIFHYYQYLQIS